MSKIEMICLANSRKLQGRCIAGLRTDGQGWIRPVGLGSDGTLFAPQYRLPNGREPQVLDVIRVGCSVPAAKPHQPENWIIDGTPWELSESLEDTTLSLILAAGFSTGPALLGNTLDRINYQQFTSMPAEASLTLVSPVALKWHVTLTEYFHRKIRANFTLRGIHYDLSVTDPKWEQRLASLPEGVHEHYKLGLNSEPTLLVSLGEPFSGYCYKLVASVF